MNQLIGSRHITRAGNLCTSGEYENIAISTISQLAQSLTELSSRVT